MTEQRVARFVCVLQDSCDIGFGCVYRNVLTHLPLIR